MDNLQNYAKKDIPASTAEKRPDATPHNRPLASEWVGLGEGKGLNIAVWPTHVQIERKERDPNTNQWGITQQISLAPMVLERIFIRFPRWFELMRENEKK